MDDLPDEAKARRRKRWRVVRRVAYWLAGIGIAIPVSAFGVAYLMLDVRSPQDVLADLDKTVVLQYSDGTDLLKVVPSDGDRLYVRYQEIPQKLRDAIIAVEDPTFWDNQGFDPMGIARAAVTGVGGGSGITQQYIKKSTGDDDATAGRKFTELVLATKITQEQSKEQIFESYINIISFGRSTSGPAAAMNAYFGRKLDDSITWSEAAFLAGMIQSPSVHDPFASSHEHAAKRWQYVADKLTSRGYVPKDQVSALAYPKDSILPPSETRAGRVTYPDYHVKQQVLTELEQLGFPLDRLRRGSMKVETTLDRQAQANAAKAVDGGLKDMPEHYRAALVAVDPATGAVRAYQGGKWSAHDYAGTPYAAGPAFYPFIATAALQHGGTLDQPYEAPFKMEFGGETFKNQNDCADEKKCSAREAIKLPADTPFVDMTRRFGVDAVSKAARDAGIPDEVDGQATLREPDGVKIGAGIAVGRYGLRPRDVAGAYATFAGDGQKVETHFVAKIRDENGQVVWQRDVKRAPGVDPRVAKTITGALQEKAADGRPIPVMRGAFRFNDTGDAANAWNAGYTTQLATAVWVGADEERRMRDANDEHLSGQNVPAAIWNAFMGT
ncbi:transglycosylase domain-containing protein [Amycolatopsis xylanica]|uniref:transglycosylase domain-containing protein n=1 Tax=Amycolatopsis xylanica TaxID=589385 RepID=UPI001FDFF332|nr:transglycosylase domain-containing protein [Amycolatopsis xylanica]